MQLMPQLQTGDVVSSAEDCEKQSVVTLVKQAEKWLNCEESIGSNSHWLSSNIKRAQEKRKKKKKTTICVFISYSYFVGVGEVERGEIQTSLGKKMWIVQDNPFIISFIKETL